MNWPIPENHSTCNGSLALLTFNTDLSVTSVELLAPNPTYLTWFQFQCNTMVQDAYDNLKHRFSQLPFCVYRNSPNNSSWRWMQQSEG